MLNQLIKSVDDITFDSARVDKFVTLAHHIRVPGSYICKISDVNGATKEGRLIVTTESQQEGLTIDCDDLFLSDAQDFNSKVSQEDHVVFVSLKGLSRYEVKIAPSQSPDDLIFHSISVGADSIIIVSPYVPGRYSISEVYSDGQADVIVSPLEDLFEDAMSSEAIAHYHRVFEDGALTVEFSAGQFSINPIQLLADQPMAISGAGPLRVKGHIVEPHPIALN